MAQAYDLIVIGSGTAAQVAAHRIAAAGWKVAVIDYRPFGGTCALRGCDPKKVLLTGAQIMDDIVRMKGRGVVAQDARILWRDLMAFKRSFTGPIPARQEQSYRESSIDAFHEPARFTAPDTVELGGGKRLQARHFVIATGARPAPLTFSGAEHLITNEEFLELDELPNRIVLVGGGYIAAEFSHIAAHAGAATALKAEPEAKLSPAEQLEHRLDVVDAKQHAKAAASEKRAEARAKGYEGEACGECGNFTLVRNGTCMKCDTCGSTTGCS